MLKEEEEDLGDMCGPMRPPPIQNKEDECVLDEVEAGPTMLPIRGSQSPQKKKKKKGRWGDSSEEEEEEEEEEAKENEEAATKGNNYKKESYLEKMMNEQAEFANFTAQQMQEEEGGGKDAGIRDTSDGKHTQKKEQARSSGRSEVNDTSER